MKMLELYVPIVSSRIVYVHSDTLYIRTSFTLLIYMVYICYACFS